MKPDQAGNNREPLGFALSAAARKLAKFYSKALTNCGLTPSQLFFLRQLWREDGLQLRELGVRAQLDATSASWLADLDDWLPGLKKANWEGRYDSLSNRCFPCWPGGSLARWVGILEEP